MTTSHSDIPKLRRWSLEEVNESNVILCDFDGTLTSGGYPEIGEPNEFVLEMVRNQRSGGEKVVLWTCRTSMYLCGTSIKQKVAIEAIEQWLHQNMSELDGILMHDKPICLLYMGDETVNPLLTQDIADKSEID
jgi:hypothetical protein